MFAVMLNSVPAWAGCCACEMGMNFWDVDEGRFLSRSDMKPFAGRCQHSIHLPWSMDVISADSYN